MTPAAIQERVQSVLGSTCTLDYPELPAIVQQALQAREGRAASAAEARRALAERHAAIRAAIVLAHGGQLLTQPLDERVRVTYRRLSINSKRYGIDKAPARQTVEKIVATLEPESASGCATL